MPPRPWNQVPLIAFGLGLIVCLSAQAATGRKAPMTPVVADAAALSGTWRGELITATGDQRLVLHLQQRADGHWAGTLDLPEQHKAGQVLDTVLPMSHGVRIASTALNCGFTGTFSAIGTTMRGSWRQGKLRTPLSLVRTKTGPIGPEANLPHAEPRRP
jgi:hypothetical protein